MRCYSFVLFTALFVYSIQAKPTPHDKVDTLIDILGRRPSSLYSSFCKVLEEENSELHDLLHEIEGTTVVMNKN